MPKTDLQIRNELQVKMNVVECKLRKDQNTPREAYIALQKLRCTPMQALSRVNKWLREFGRSEFYPSMDDEVIHQRRKQA
jgi:hypothetical protein